MKNLKYKLLLILGVSLASCEKGGDLVSLKGDTYIITASADAKQLSPASVLTTTSTVNGWLDKEGRVLTLTVAWQNLNQGAPDTIQSVAIYASTGVTAEPVRLLRFINSSNNGSMNMGLAGNTGFTSDQVAQLIEGNYYYTINTAKYPSGLVKGKLIATMSTSNK